MVDVPSIHEKCFSSYQILGCYPGANANEAFSLTSRRMTEFSRGYKPIERATKVSRVAVMMVCSFASSDCIYLRSLGFTKHFARGSSSPRLQSCQRRGLPLGEDRNVSLGIRILMLQVGVRHDSSANGEIDKTITSDGERALSLLSCR